MLVYVLDLSSCERIGKILFNFHNDLYRFRKIKSRTYNYQKSEKRFFSNEHDSNFIIVIIKQLMNEI